MSREHFDTGSSEHERPLYNAHLGEAHPLAGEGPYSYGPAIDPEVTKLPKPFTTKSGENYNTLISASRGGDFEVSMHPDVHSWEPTQSHNFVDRAFNAYPYHRAEDPTQGTLIRPVSRGHEYSVAHTDIEVSDPYGETDHLDDAVHVSMISTDPDRRGQGLAMHMLRASKQFAGNEGNRLVADHLRSDMGTALGRKAAKEDPHAQNEQGEYISEEKNLKTISPVGNSSYHDIRADAANGGTDEVKQKAAEEGTKARIAIRDKIISNSRATAARRQHTQGDLFADHVVVKDWDQPRNAYGRVPNVLVPKGGEAHTRAKQGPLERGIR